MIIPGHSYRGELNALTDAERASADRMRDDVMYLSETIGERNTCNPAELAKAEEYISASFSRIGYSHRLETYSTDGVNSTLSHYVFVP